VETVLHLEQLSDEMEYATVVAWHHPDGAEVSAGEPLLDIEIDKVTMTIDSPASGVLVQHVGVDNDAVVGDPLATIRGT
jgi:pyruvate/2-oxoglutarate dehydrogenase complex dihydrolipoamide acyltransferase (E2) component